MMDSSAEHIDYRSEVDMLLSIRHISPYMASYLLKMPKAGINEEMWQEAIEDAKTATTLGVNNEEEYSLFFYIDHFVNDICKELLGIRLSDLEIKDLKKYMFDMRDQISFNNLVAFRAAVLDWIRHKKSINTVAHPNIGAAPKPLSKYNIRRWYEYAETIKNMVISGILRHKALNDVVKQIEVPERYDFLSWYRYYANEEDKKYSTSSYKQVIKTGYNMDIIKSSYYDDNTHYYIPKMNRDLFNPVAEKKEELVPDPPMPSAANLIDSHKKSEQYAVDFEAARGKLMSRTFAIDRLLEKYRKVLPDSEIESIEDTLNDLRKKVRKLKFASSVIDSIVKTANIFRKKHFNDGAALLFAMAEDPMRSPVEIDPQTEHESIQQTTVDKSKDQKLQSIVSELETINAVLKNREIIRSLAKVDLQLHDIHMATFFPELTEAQSRLIDAFGYSSNKVEDVLPKIKGSIMAEQAKAEEHMSAQEIKDTIPSDKKQVDKEVNDLAAPLKLNKGPDKEVSEKPTLEVSQPAMRRPLPPIRPIK